MKISAGSKNATYHYFGITYPNSQFMESIGEVLKSLRSQRKHPLLKIHIGFAFITDTLKNKKVLSDMQIAFKKIAIEKDVYPVIHYKPKSPAIVMGDLQRIGKLFPKMKIIQINDNCRTYLSVLEKFAKRFRFIIPLNDGSNTLVNDIRFRKIVLGNNSFLLLDNSGGRGKHESYPSYKKKIDSCIAYGLNNIGLAGGFGPEALGMYFKISDYYKFDFSIDAESRLQKGGKLDVAATKSYFSQLSKGVSIYNGR